jgi:hypothetical protein
MSTPKTPIATRIDRLRLDIPGGSAGHGRKIASLVAAGLANAGGLPQAGDLPTLRVTITADHHCDPATLAHHIVAATLRELARTP